MALRWRLDLERAYAPFAARLAAAYGRVQQTLAGEIRALLATIAQQEAAGATITPALIGRLAGYRALLATIEREAGGFAALARFEAAALADDAVRRGTRGVLEAVLAQGAAGQLAAANWGQLDPEMIRALVGYVDSEAMRAKFAQFGQAAAGDFADVMLALAAAGKGSRTIARALNAWLSVPYAWAENMTRTAQLYSYRAATAASFAANADLLDGWLWEATLDGRVCMSCLLMHGTLHPISEMLNDHHRGRCVPVPVVRGTTWAQQVEGGRDWYERLPAGTQRRLAGDLLWVALRDDPNRWNGVSATYADDVFGAMRRQASVRELVTNPAAYAALQAQARGLAINATTVEMAAQAAAESRMP